MVDPPTVHLVHSTSQPIERSPWKPPGCSRWMLAKHCNEPLMEPAVMDLRSKIFGVTTCSSLCKTITPNQMGHNHIFSSKSNDQIMAVHAKHKNGNHNVQVTGVSSKFTSNAIRSLSTRSIKYGSWVVCCIQHPILPCCRLSKSTRICRLRAHCSSHQHNGGRPMPCSETQKCHSDFQNFQLNGYITTNQPGKRGTAPS
jgi:hypothetical protein